MAYPARITIATGGRVTERWGGQEASVSVTYILDENDRDIQALVAEKVAEVEAAQTEVWRRITSSPGVRTEAAEPPPPSIPKAPSATAPQKAAIRGCARRLGRTEKDIIHLVRERFGKPCLDALAKPETSAVLLSFGEGQWPSPADIVL